MSRRLLVVATTSAAPGNFNFDGSYYVGLLVTQVSDWTAYPGALTVYAICQQ